MKALRRKDTKEWLSRIDSDGMLYTGTMPKEISDAMKSVEQIQNAENSFRHENCYINLSDYELVTIRIAAEEDCFTSMCCDGERCMCCGEPAKHKIEETIFTDDPHQFRHPLTGYLCEKHFDMVLRPYNDKRNIEQIAKDEWTALHINGISFTAKDRDWEYWLKAFQIAMRMNIPPRVNILTERIQAIAKSAQFVENSPANEYNHGKHTAAHMILDELNEIFYGKSSLYPTPTFTTGVQETELGYEKGWQGWVKIDNQTFYLQVSEDKEHAEWYLNCVITALRKLMIKSATDEHTGEEGITADKK